MTSEAESIRGFDVVVSNEAETTVVSLSGELDIATADRLTKALDAISVEPGGRLAVDLSAVKFMDSTGLRLLISAHRTAGEGGYKFAVVAGGSPAKRVFELTKMDDHITVIDTLSEFD